MIPRWQPDVRFRKRGDRGFVVRGTDAYELNGVGAFIWALLDGDHDRSDIAEAVADHFSIDIATAKDDTEEYLATLTNLGLVVES